MNTWQTLILNTMTLAIASQSLSFAGCFIAVLLSIIILNIEKNNKTYLIVSIIIIGIFMQSEILLFAVVFVSINVLFGKPK